MAKETKTPVIDFTDAKELGPLPDGLYVFAISKWQYGSSGSGAPKVDIESTVVKPEGIKGRVFDSVNLVNEYTKARVLNILAATGEFGTKEELMSQSKFVAPDPAEVIGLQYAGRTKTEQNEGYNPRSLIAKVMSVEEYDAAQ